MTEVNIVGTLDSATFVPESAAAAFARWKLVAGPSWEVASGPASGATQICEVAAASDASDSRSVEWSQAFDVRLSAGDLAGWPQLAVTVWQQDPLQRNEIIGYGCIRIPTSPGVHQLEMVTWRPQGEWMQELSAWFLGGGHPHLTDTRMVTDPSGGGRHRISSITSCVVRVEVQVLVRGFEEKGVTFVTPAGGDVALGASGGSVPVSGRAGVAGGGGGMSPFASAAAATTV